MGGCHLLDANNVKPEAHQPMLCGRWRITAFMGFSDYTTHLECSGDKRENANYGL
jgi:hypothetical protein